MMTIEGGSIEELQNHLHRMLIGDLEEFGMVTEAHEAIISDLVNEFVFDEELVTR